MTIPSKRRLRFTLRTLLVALTASAVGAGWFAHYVQKRREAFAAIKEAGGKIRMLVGEPTRLERWFGPEAFGQISEIDMRDGRADNALLLHIGVLAEVRKLDLSDANIDDEGLERITNLPLRSLWLQGTPITDASAAALSRIKSLGFLQLNGTELTDAFLARLEPMPALTNLGLRGTNVTTAGMSHLTQHPKLTTLDVYLTAVDSDGLRALVDCPSLDRLGLSATKVSDDVFPFLDQMPKLFTVDLNGNRGITTEAVRAFEKTHPRCEVVWNGD